MRHTKSNLCTVFVIFLTDGNEGFVFNQFAHVFAAIVDFVLVAKSEVCCQLYLPCLGLWIAYGEYCVIWIPFVLWNSANPFCCKYGCSSIWCAAGTTLVSFSSLSSSAFEKLEMPIARVLPDLRVFSMAL